MAIFSEHLRELRQARGLSQPQLAKELEINYRSYQRYEYGEVEPQLSALIKMADFFDISLDDLVGRKR